MFNPNLRQHIDPKNKQWKILSELESDAQQLYDDLHLLKTKDKSTSKGAVVASHFAKRSAKTRLKWKDPW